jgi:hypothetical protein
MQELQLISTGKVMIGGTTKPFTILALNEAGYVEEYIVKAFTKNQLAQNASVAKEIIVSELAKMFDITIPEYGIINCTIEDLERVYEDDRERIESLDLGAKFCSKFMKQYPIFTKVTSKSYLQEYEILNIFAFDLLTFNVDRGGHRNKPNLLINDKELIIIDHELTFPFIVNNYKTIEYEKYLVTYQYKKHVLLKYIKQLKKENRVFYEFLENLKNLNINELEKIFDKLDYYKIHYFERIFFMNYLIWAKNNVSIFERYLTAMTK